MRQRSLAGIAAIRLAGIGFRPLTKLRERLDLRRHPQVESPSDNAIATEWAIPAAVDHLLHRGFASWITFVGLVVGEGEHPIGSCGKQQGPSAGAIAM